MFSLVVIQPRKICMSNWFMPGVRDCDILYLTFNNTVKVVIMDLNESSRGIGFRNGLHQARK